MKIGFLIYVESATFVEFFFLANKKDVVKSNIP